MKGAGKSQTGPCLRRVVSPSSALVQTANKSSQPPAFASSPVRCCAASPSRSARDLARSCKQCASRVYFEPRRSRRRRWWWRRRGRRENSLQGGGRQSRWLRGEAAPSGSCPHCPHAVCVQKPQILLSDRYKLGGRKQNVGPPFFPFKTQRLHSVGSSHLRPGSHTNHQPGDEAVRIYTRAWLRTPPEPLLQSHSGGGGAFHKSITFSFYFLP